MTTTTSFFSLAGQGKCAAPVAAEIKSPLPCMKNEKWPAPAEKYCSSSLSGNNGTLEVLSKWARGTKQSGEHEQELLRSLPLPRREERDTWEYRNLHACLHASAAL